MTKTQSQMKVTREICISGPVIDVTLKSSRMDSSGKRQPKHNPTREAVIQNNDRLAVKSLTRLMNANFYPGDWHITLTYSGSAPTQKEAKNIVKNFKARMKREYKKLGKEFLYIEVTEYENQRIHHHILLPYIDLSIIQNQWKDGYIKAVGLDRSRNYHKLAAYFIKQTSKTMRKPGNETKKRWSASKNLKRPIVKRETITVRGLFEQPKEFKGYAIDVDTVRRYEHPFTGLEHLEYMMTATDPVPRLKTWRKGKIVDREETYKRASQIQIDMESLEEWLFV